MRYTAPFGVRGTSRCGSHVFERSADLGPNFRVGHPGMTALRDRFKRSLPFLPAIALLLAMGGPFVACNEEPVPPADIAGAAVWSAGERAEYALMDGDERIGQGVFSVERSGEGWVLRQEYRAKLSDVVAVEVGVDLKPRSVTRTIDGPDGPITMEVVYADGRAVVHADNGREQGVYGADIPAYTYDNWEGTFLWRTLPLQDGYRVAYVNMATAAPRDPVTNTATVQVQGRERIMVPAGEFDAWKLKVSSGGSTETAWIGVDAPHPLVRYDNGSNTFELEKFER